MGSERISRRNTVAASLRYGRLSNIAVVPCDRPSQGSVQAAANGIAPALLKTARRRLEQQADFPMSGVIAERDGRAIGARACRRACESIRNSLPPSAAGFQPMPAFCVQPNRSPEGRSRSIFGGQAAARPPVRERAWRSRTTWHRLSRMDWMTSKSLFSVPSKARNGAAGFGKLREIGVGVLPDLEKALVLDERGLPVARLIEKPGDLEYVARVEQPGPFLRRPRHEQLPVDRDGAGAIAARFRDAGHAVARGNLVHQCPRILEIQRDPHSGGRLARREYRRSLR